MKVERRDVALAAADRHACDLELGLVDEKGARTAVEHPLIGRPPWIDDQQATRSDMPRHRRDRRLEVLA
jgi:hypothetical protein